ncbi:unnamed protein product [Blepharisma stoltei]|uniref:Uncharacterized protein n=1 Tax=Blepharisma stoltei TaxID=1481888 RepID=A0AAU9JHP2_9CILI|nr:unnamed protein product [Blepharisma stoltei]
MEEEAELIKTGSLSGQFPENLIKIKTKELEILRAELALLLQEYNLLKNKQKPEAHFISEIPKPQELLETKHSIESSPNSTNSIKNEEDKVEKLKRKIGQTTFDSLREVFLMYSGVQNYLLVDKLESMLFNRFLADFNLYNSLVTKAQADVYFFKGLKGGRSINFWRFVEILIKLAKIDYPDKEKYKALQDYATEKIEPRLNNEKDKAKIKRLHEIYLSQEVKGFINANKGLLEDIYERYKSSDVVHANRMRIQGFVNLLAKYEFIPSHISSPLAALLFRSVPSTLLFNDSLLYEGFVEACVYVALEIYEGPQFSSFGLSPAQCLKTWIDYLIPRFEEYIEVSSKESKPKESSPKLKENGEKSAEV